MICFYDKRLGAKEKLRNDGDCIITRRYKSNGSIIRNEYTLYIKRAENTVRSPVVSGHGIR